MHCPNCGTKYAFFEKRCTRCDVELVDDDAEQDGTDPAADSRAQPEVRQVSVFKTDDAAILPLATMALDAEGIPYILKHAGKVDSLDWMMSQSPTNRAVVMEIVVGSDAAAKAREVLADLERESRGTTFPVIDISTSEEPVAPESTGVVLQDAASGRQLGLITESQLQDLTSRLEEEKPQEYFITSATVDMLQGEGVDAALVALLRQAVGAGDSGLSVKWSVE